MLNEEAQKLMGEHRDVGKFVKHIADRINDKEQEHYVEVAQGRIGGDKEISGEYEAGVRKGIEIARMAIVEVLEETVDDQNHKGDKHHKPHFKDGID
ncbi:hypothetical protein DFQ01_10878 [Paenibacillus cellulosilyticus]|uniref:Uncharacterized protein n=1 Tax=Paenibacillus cellulosilyticus TaxID=375489 RepID=A0A2V2YUV5_9BACL|nr:hypothetical protein [Paenibacillus cellulosilyticus]PWW02802.1 hypothetical protein DFQ01_10878 [Paenibacillus cellulosilyticus]QKS45724.1 hypothetical protein HUB94_15725 [Paenibacillus cellulosilyticus]